MRPSEYRFNTNEVCQRGVWPELKELSNDDWELRRAVDPTIEDVVNS